MITSDSDDVKWQRSTDASDGEAVMTSSGEITSTGEVTTDTPGSLASRRRRRRRRCSSTPSTSTKRRSVHLWQFLRDLLQLPQRYHAGVRWIDRDAGQIFFRIMILSMILRFYPCYSLRTRARCNGRIECYRA